MIPSFHHEFPICIAAVFIKVCFHSLQGMPYVSEAPMKPEGEIFVDSGRRPMATSSVRVLSRACSS